ncbi:ABC transporter ATP-binding protein [Alicyclobacillus ferrooxydans]|uniref:ABC transporter ATP-binding protein n=1 Tax=Alicyclobacillus ferrooxydans TaxID=471514 RepID=UPI0006D53CFF|nr:ATP-binding cassette domain-containing protein [Alicyclobacillus ferrooxydans]
MPIVTVDHLTYRYGGASSDALKDVSLQIEPGEWVVIQGVTGSGKSTLLKTLTGACPEFYGGTIQGSVALGGKAVHEMTVAERVGMVGFVNQDPEAGTVYDVTDREVAFTLENQGLPGVDMAWRVAEAMELAGLSEVALRHTSELSGGQRQRLALAAALVHQPRILVLDEPSSQLDPVSASDLLDHLRRLQEEFGMTIVMSEHRLDAVYAVADRAVFMADGEIKYIGSTRDMARWTRIHAPGQTPAIARLFPTDESPALSVREAREHLLLPNEQKSQPDARNDWSAPSARRDASHEPFAAAANGEINEHGHKDENGYKDGHGHKDENGYNDDHGHKDENGYNDDHGHKDEMTRHRDRRVITLDRVSARYRGASELTLRDCSLELQEGQATAVIGPNGSGKSTLLRVLAGLMPVESGRLTAPTANRQRKRWLSRKDAPSYPGDLKVGYLPQKPSDLFSQLKVRDEILLGLRLAGGSAGEMTKQLERVSAELRVGHLLDRSPRDLSGGEQMQVALAGLLVTNPSVLLLDEPTRGLDAEQKVKVGALIKELTQRRGLIVVMVSHDMELVAQTADQVLFLFNGSIALRGGPDQVFSKGLYFSPPVARVFRGFDDRVLSLEDAVQKGWAR